MQMPSIESSIITDSIDEKNIHYGKLATISCIPEAWIKTQKLTTRGGNYCY